MNSKGLYKRKDSPFWHISIYHNGRHYRFTTKTTSLRIAEQIHNKKKSQLLAGEITEIADTKLTLNQLGDMYLNFAKTKKKSSSDRDKQVIDRLLEFFGPDLKISRIRVYDVERYQAKRMAEGRKPGTINKEVTCMKAMFNKAVSWDKLRINPIKAVRQLKVNNVIVRFLSLAEMNKLIECSAPYMRDIIIFALNTGMRRGEILGLDWKDVDFENRFIAVRDTKSSEDRKIPMNSTLADLLTPLKKTEGKVFLGRGGVGMKDVKKGFHRTMKDAGIKNFRFHDLRHTFASHLVMNGIDIVTVKELLGHKSLEMTLRYAHLSAQHKSLAVEHLAKAYSKPYTENLAEVKA
jgi:integrase